MRNSIEEDILNIEKYVELVIDKNYCDCNELNVICAGNHRDGSKNVAYSIQHILSDYKRVLKENEELNLKYYMLYTGKIENMKAQEVKIKSQVIPVKKVKDKMEELKKNLYTVEHYETVGAINVLQELLEGRK